MLNASPINLFELLLIGSYDLLQLIPFLIHVLHLFQSLIVQQAGFSLIQYLPDSLVKGVYLSNGLLFLLHGRPPESILKLHIVKFELFL